MKLDTWGRFNNGDLIIWKLLPNHGKSCPQMWTGYDPRVLLFFVEALAMVRLA